MGGLYGCHVVAFASAFSGVGGELWLGGPLLVFLGVYFDIMVHHHLLLN